MHRSARNGGDVVISGGTVSGNAVVTGFVSGATFTIAGGNLTGGRFTADEYGDVFIDANEFRYAADPDNIPNDVIPIPPSGELVIDSSSPYFSYTGIGHAIPRLSADLDDGNTFVADFVETGGWSGTLHLRLINPPCHPGDVNCDGAVNVTDFGVFAADFGANLGDANYNPDADFNSDSSINVLDFGVFAGDFGCPN